MDRNSELENEIIRMDKGSDMQDRQERNEYIFSRKALNNSKSQGKFLVLAGIGVLILIILFSSFFIGVSKARKDISSIRANFDQVEKRLNQVEEKIARLNKEIITNKGDFDKNMEEWQSQKLSLERRLDEQSTRIGQLKEAKSTLATKKKSSEIVDEKPIPQTKNRYHEVRKGETLYGVASRYGISVDELCRLNQITAKTVIRPGQKLLVFPGS
jgi:septal ring factor EnvC (AmiA/AmiB activator)